MCTTSTDQVVAVILFWPWSSSRLGIKIQGLTARHRGPSDGWNPTEWDVRS